jgi:hypothetical protein
MAFYTILKGLGVTALMQTFTHSLGLDPATLVARPIQHQPAIGQTAGIAIGTIGTNIVTASAWAGALQTFDLEVQQIHSLIA